MAETKAETTNKTGNKNAGKIEEEKQVLSFWKSQKTYEKLVKKNSGSGKKFYMMDGPPYANGHIHIGHALNKTLKDIAIRVKRMQGYDVFDRVGYDTHGVPIELKIEKEIDSKGKQDIEKYGVAKFVKRCKEFATQYIDAMNAEFQDLGVWMNFNNPYLTLSDDWIEASWAALKEAEKKGLLYLGKYPVHVCTRCGTAVAFNEIEYGKQKDNSIYVKFPLKNKKNTFLIIWTTTPWTLPGNTGVMVNPNVEYQEIEMSNGERWIIAKELVPEIMTVLERGYTPKEVYKGKKMEGWEYVNPLAKNLKLKVKNGYKVVLSARYVTTEDGTGLVHSAPGHGKEDYEVGKEYGLDNPSPVGINGLMTAEAGKYAGKKAREVDKEIIEDLKKDGMLVYQLEYEHDYPLCWRDKSPLLMISQPQWFIKVLDIKDKLLKENEKTKWVPDWMKLRMKAWLEGLSDWPVSRQRYWGTPIPIWHNEETGEKVVVGSLDELKKLSGAKTIDTHKPGIDKIEIKSKKTGKILNRVPEVLDVWFDSGVASWAALGYPKNDKLLKEFWPADLNIEGRDQFRGWWNSQMILSQILFDKKPFEAIVVHGMMLDLGKKKMSKSLGNVVNPQEVISQFGRDYLRYYFAKFSKGEDFSYDEDELVELQKITTTLSNVNSFVEQIEKGKENNEIEDKWIMSKFNSLVKNVSSDYDNYKFSEAMLKMEEFIINDLSRKYIRIIRERSVEAQEVLRHVLKGIIQLYAPVMPFFAETIWQKWHKKEEVKEESVHMSEWPKFDEKKINLELEKKFNSVLMIIERGLAERDKIQVGLKWPLAKATIFIEEELGEEFEGIIMKQLNVKKISIKKAKELSVEYDTKITPELEAEGFARNIIRSVQAFRKELGLKPENEVETIIISDDKLKKMLSKHEKYIKEKTNSKKLQIATSSKETFKNKTSFKIKDKTGEIIIIV